MNSQNRIHQRDALAAQFTVLLTAPATAFSFPFWVPLFASLILIWRSLALWWDWPNPSRYLRILLTLTVLTVVLLTFQTVGGVQAGGSFLILLTALKTLESHTKRDWQLVLLLVWMTWLAILLVTHDVLLVMYAFAVLWLTLAALWRLQNDEEVSYKVSLRRSGVLFAQALPFGLILFLLFPRLPGAFWSLNLGQPSSISGLPTQMTPGNIQHLALSQNLVFKVRFFGPVPKRRYFRGVVLTHFNGRSWTQLPALPGHAQIIHTARQTHYRVVEEANRTRYLFALAMPLSVDRPATLTANYELLAPKPLQHPIRFTATSALSYRLDPHLSKAARRRNLSLPPGTNPRARALARHWRKSAKRPIQIVRRALQWFAQKPYQYTLNPTPLRGPNEVDEFLFKTRNGFCEHFASAFAFLMRAAGIPARIVMGYAGGQINPYDGWLMVRQSNAHAWDEVWLRGRGWVRADPTGVIPPGRVHITASAAAAEGTSAFTYQIEHSAFFGQVRDFWDAVNTDWNGYVIGYGPALQAKLLNLLGLASGITVLIGLLGGSVVIYLAFMAAVISWRRQSPQRPDPAQRLYQRFCRRLSRQGLPRHPHEAPLAYLERIRRKLPQFHDQAAQITRLYLKARYHEQPQALRQLRSAVQDFHL